MKMRRIIDIRDEQKYTERAKKRNEKKINSFVSDSKQEPPPRAPQSNKKEILIPNWAVIGLIIFISMWLIQGLPSSDEAPQISPQAYQSALLTIENQQNDLKTKWTDDPMAGQQEIQDFLYNTITTEIFPAWYGTSWDFNGTTQIPQEGAVACGYFVSTCLQHAGFEIDRRKVGQQAASIIIETFCALPSIERYTKRAQLEKYLNKHGKGIYILGLDKHVGFIWHDGQQTWMVHSTKGGKSQVVKQKLFETASVKRSKILMVGNLLDHPSILLKWLYKEKIPIKK